MFRIILLSAIVLTQLSACSKRSTENAIQVGPITATGTLIPAEVSLVRRGSHALVIEGKSRYFVESKTENLREYEGRIVSVRGTLEQNTKKGDLPFIIAESISSNVGGEGLRIWNIPALNLRVTTPEPWKGKIQGSTASFGLEGEANPLLTIRLMSGTTLPKGSSFYVKNRPAVKTEPESSTVQEIYVLERSTILQIHFDPSTQKSITSADEARVLTAEFDRVLSELSFLTDTKLKSLTTGSGSHTACGGPAGILCETGFYCDVGQGTEGIGICKKR